MKKIIIYGAGDSGLYVAYYLINNPTFAGGVKIVGIIDKNLDLQCRKPYGIKVYNLESALQLDYDLIIISVMDEKIKLEIFAELLLSGISKDRILFINRTAFDILRQGDSRFDFVRRCKELNLNGLEGNIAEAGVYTGEFAYRLNGLFYSKKLYLFDTFAGFDERDVLSEVSLGDDAFVYSVFTNERVFQQDENAVENVMKKMPFPENIIVKKGYIPDTFSGIDDKFCFVNLDMDLYQPMLEGCKFFWHKLVDGGMMMLHDYYHNSLLGVRKAVTDFEIWLGQEVIKIPAMSAGSLLIIKK